MVKMWHIDQRHHHRLTILRRGGKPTVSVSGVPCLCYCVLRGYLSGGDAGISFGLFNKIEKKSASEYLRLLVKPTVRRPQYPTKKNF